MTKKGFTLIELLAVIVILAVISLITVPTITGIIDDTKKESLKSTANGIIDAVSYDSMSSILNNNTQDKKTYIFPNSGLSIKGKEPDSGYITYNKDGTSHIVINDKNNCAIKKYSDLEVKVYPIDSIECKSLMLLEPTKEECFQTRNYTYDTTKVVIEEYLCGATGGWSVAENSIVLTTKAEVEFPVIPDTINGKEVVGIDCFAFSNYFDESYVEDNTKKVFISGINFTNSKHLQFIGISSFDFNMIKKVYIPDTVASIGRHAFYENLLTEISIPNSITTIEPFSFAYNYLTSLTIPNSVTTISNDAFSDNDIPSVVIPNSVTTIGSTAFANNKLLTKIEIDKANGSIAGSPWGATNATVSWLR